MGYRELPALGRSAPHVACVWFRDPEPAPHRHRVVPDACADVVWIQGERLSVAGPATGPVLTEVPAGASAMGVRFRVGAAGSALGVPAGELLDATVALEDVWGLGALHLAERLHAAKTPRDAAALLTAAVAKRLPPPSELDSVVRAAALRAAAPRAPVEAPRAGPGGGQRQLRRRLLGAARHGPETLPR